VSDASAGKRPDGAPSTPFDNPFFLPVLLVVFTVWFAYDGWLNPETEWVRFNRYGALVCLALAILTARRAVRERRSGS
jgi:hypothetical protein